ncbi:hypothetical protein ACIBQ1_20510 [Nonomuraea sp. NPDC050153]|uniref:hypothetical protein n=1 Tax=Nonomuraea sp. NPDC050153 TaxID=3364359 RepID=UPI0037A6EA4B
MRGTDTGDDGRTPDLDDCRPGCRNLARTDQDLAIVHQHATDLRAMVDDPLSPSIRHDRERGQLDRLEKIITQHGASVTDDEAEPDEKLLKDLWAANDRLIAGTALRSSGKLAVSARSSARSAARTSDLDLWRGPTTITAPGKSTLLLQRRSE